MTEYFFFRWINSVGYIYTTHSHLCLCAHLSVDVSLASFSELLSGCFFLYFHCFWIFCMCFQCQKPNYPMFSASFTQEISIFKPPWCCFLVSWIFRLDFLDKVYDISTWHCPLLHISSHTCYPYIMYKTLTLGVISSVHSHHPPSSISYPHRPMADSASGSTIIVLV